MKQRFSYLDLRLVTNEVENELTNCYLQNIYSLENSNRHFLFKFDAGVREVGKRFLIVDPGMRYHLTKYQHHPTNQPSYFVQKLRKFLKNRRATNFWVPPSSRLVVITFTEGQFYLVFEFFAGGNILLLNADLIVLTLFRVVRDVGPNHQNYQVGETYDIPKEKLSEKEILLASPTLEDLEKWVGHEKLGKALFSRISNTSSSLLEFYLRKNNLDPKQKLSIDPQGAKLNTLKIALDSLQRRAHALMKLVKAPGYILYDKDGNPLEFEPFPEYFNMVHPDKKVEQYQSYNETVDLHFGAILSEKGTNKVEKLHALALNRLEAAHNESRKRVEGLLSQLTVNEQMGQAIEENANVVESAISAVKALVDQGADWGDADKLIRLEKQKGNSIAETIESLQLDQRRFTIKLDSLSISISIDCSAHANARHYFEIRKAALTKIEKTELHANKALKSAEIKIKRDLEANLNKHKQAGAVAQLHAIRTPHWFEKFWWFLTSTSHLVIAARDDTQRNILLRRYFNDGDLAVSSDATGASLLIIKQKPDSDISPQALMQATAFCVGTSVKSWEAKSKAPGWFLTRKQVPKINSNGDPISFNDLILINPRTVIPAPQLDMGVALLWQYETRSSDPNDQISAGKTPLNEEPAFPDTQFDSDDEFSDTNMDSNASGSGDDSYRSDSQSDNGSTSLSEHLSKCNMPQDFRSNSTLSVSSTDSESFNNLQGFESTNDANLSSSMSSGVNLPVHISPSEPSSSWKSQSFLPKKVRGNKKKLQKYLAQDEEERKAAMERLGTLKGVVRKESEQKEKEKARIEQQAQIEQRKERRRKNDLAFISDAELSPEPQPFPSDLRNTYEENTPIVAAIPMFAPWASMQKAQYKVKLVHGSMKKGKASSEVLKVISKTGNKPAGECEEKLISAIRPVDLQQSIAVSRVQIATTTNVKGGKGSDTRSSKAKLINQKKK